MLKKCYQQWIALLPNSNRTSGKNFDCHPELLNRLICDCSNLRVDEVLPTMECIALL
uniref:Uncharacterized protein n=1 Tax=Nelumbo nucifera TaxID=4432 RepID=A0A822Y0I3_NELNU|nr:TPA_asm: hypothetical protein HUJ06_026039 [Nelumbo nucifera]